MFSISFLFLKVYFDLEHLLNTRRIVSGDGKAILPRKKLENDNDLKVTNYRHFADVVCKNFLRSFTSLTA